MTLKEEKISRLVLYSVLALFVIGCGTSKRDSGQVFGHFQQSSSAQTQDTKGTDEQAREVLDRVLKNLRYSRYWYERPDVGDDYAVGKQVSALIFWTKSDRPYTAGFCSPNIARCFATSGIQISPMMEQMAIDHSITPMAAFVSFLENGMGANTIQIIPKMKTHPPPVNTPPAGSSNPPVSTIPSQSAGHPVLFPKRLSLVDFEFTEKIITLPPLGLPSSILRREVPEEAYREANSVKQSYTCWYENSVRASRCTGTLVFAYYNEADSNWFVLRTCSSACLPVFQGDSIQLLRRWDDGKWAASGASGINSPKEEVARLKQKILQAEMIRHQLP